MKMIEVTISQTLSSNQKIEVPDDIDIKNNYLLEQYVNEQIMLPSDYLEIEGDNNWIVDEFCVINTYNNN